MVPLSREDCTNDGNDNENDNLRPLMILPSVMIMINNVMMISSFNIMAPMTLKLKSKVVCDFPYIYQKETGICKIITLYCQTQTRNQIISIMIYPDLHNSLEQKNVLPNQTYFLF